MNYKSCNGYSSTFFMMILLPIISQILFWILASMGYTKIALISMLIILLPCVLVVGLVLLALVFFKFLDFLVWIGNKLGWEWAIELLELENPIVNIKELK